MPHEGPADHPEHVGALQRYAREQLGVDVQAIGRADRYVRVDGGPMVWQVMTEVGNFWLVERGGVIELFLAAVAGRVAGHATPCRFPNQAARRYLELHPSV